MNKNLKTIYKFLPEYLLPLENEKIKEEIKNLNEGSFGGYYINNFLKHKNDMFQGDGWTGFSLQDFDSGKKSLVSGVVISNSCSIAPENKHRTPINVTFAPIMKLSDYESLLPENSRHSEKIEQDIANIRSQKKYKYFYLPPTPTIGCECFIPFDELHTMPLKAHTKGKKLFSFSEAGFYFFLFKFAVYFCRMGDFSERN